MAASKQVRTVTVRGPVPRVSICWATYSNSYLHSHPELLGSQVVVEIDPADLRTVKCRTENGMRLPDLQVTGAWSSIRHSLAERRKLYAALSKKPEVALTRPDPIDAYLATLACRRAPTNDGS